MADDEYTYEVIENESDARLCAQLLAEEFAAHDPITVLDQITPRCFLDECAWPLLASVLNERLSFLARHRSSGEIVGAIAAGDLYLSNVNYPYDATRPAEVIAANDLFDEMDNIFICRDFGQELKPNMVLHITIAAVRAQHSGKGVATRLSIVMCNHARDTKGFLYALVQVTNPATRHIYVNKMGGKEVTILDPTTWLWTKKGDGLSCPFKNYNGGSIPNILIQLRSVDCCAGTTSGILTLPNGLSKGEL